VNREHEQFPTTRRVVGVCMRPLDQNAVLDGNALDLARARADERELALCRLGRLYAQRLTAPADLEQLQPRRAQLALGRVRLGRVTEQRSIRASPQPVSTWRLLIADPARQLVDMSQLVEHDGVVAHSGPHEREAVGDQRVEQRLQPREAHVRCGIFVELRHLAHFDIT